MRQNAALVFIGNSLLARAKKVPEWFPDKVDITLKKYEFVCLKEFNVYKYSAPSSTPKCSIHCEYDGKFLSDKAESNRSDTTNDEDDSEDDDDGDDLEFEPLPLPPSHPIELQYLRKRFSQLLSDSE